MAIWYVQYLLLNANLKGVSIWEQDVRQPKISKS